jgi:uncharacterized protein
MPALELLAAEARSIRALAGDVPSPCTSVCRMDARTGWCEGCFRRLEEIGGWSSMADAEKRTVWARIEQRISAIQDRPS